MNLYYIKQGNKGVIRNIYTSSNHILSHLNKLIINNEKVVNVGSDYIFTISENSEQVITLKNLDSPYIGFDLDELKLIELGTLNSKGSVIASESITFESIKDLNIEIGYKRHKLTDVLLFSEGEIIPTEDIKVYHLNAETQESLIIAYLKSKVIDNPELSFHHEVCFSRNKFSLKVTIAKDLKDVVDDLLEGKSLKVEDVLTSSEYVYNSEDDVFPTPLAFYSKELLNDYIEQTFKLIDSLILGRIKFFRLGGALK